MGAAWSPVGDRLALIGPDALHVVGIRGGRARRLGAADEELLDATFTADGVALLPRRRRG
ncbi:MAG: hypothetical protein R3B09_12335 [Nannocystaceae bacterium]